MSTWEERYMSNNNSNLANVLTYYDAINKKQPEVAAKKLAENVSIKTPLDERSGKDAVVDALKGFCSVVKEVTITDHLVQDDKVMLTYDILFPEPIGNLRAAGLLVFSKGLITSIELFYDGRIMEQKKDEIFIK